MSGGSPRDYLHSLELVGVKLGLEQIRALVNALGRPDLACRTIVIAGTNGKGSVTAMVERGLREAGYRTGRYISPHLVDLEERFAVDGIALGADAVDAAVETVRTAAATLPAPPSYFEATTAMALDLFRGAGVDVAVLEVGLGGRLDATNVVTPIGVAITSIDFDHEQYLGHTIDAIAREKAGVIKPAAAAVLAENPAVVQDVVRRRCADVGAPYVYAPNGVRATTVMVDGRAKITLETPALTYSPITLALRGRHQVDNAIAAVRLLETLGAASPLTVSAVAIRAGLEDVVWPGRLELLRWRGHEILIDGAHNPAGARALASYLAETYGRRLPVVFGAMRDKKIGEVVRALAPAASRFICTAPPTTRAATPDELAAIVRAEAPDVPASVASNPIAAISDAIGVGSPIVVAGSLFLAGAVRREVS